MAGKYWYIRQRDNPQFSIAQGNLTVSQAKKAEGSIYGHNTMLKFNTLEEYLTKCKELEIVAKT